MPCFLAYACSSAGVISATHAIGCSPTASNSSASHGRYLVADPAPLWQKPLVSLTQLFLKTPVQVRACQQDTVLTKVLGHLVGRELL